ncbi:MAG: glycosyltransferase family 4 protein [Bacteroidia bacterium]|nr:glycosyltransferase family 4 protein [Bacteroidia bacterium]
MHIVKQRTIVVLYPELAGYTLACLQSLITEHNVVVHVFRLAVNKDAPFEFNAVQGLHFYNESDYTAAQLLTTVSALQPQLIYCAGWNNSKYLHVVRYLQNIPAVLCFDNKWIGSLKQRLGSLYARVRITPYFTHVFVAGEQQKKLALHMGFAPAQVQLGVYAANVPHFDELYKKYVSYKLTKTTPRRFVYSGRYVAYKGIETLWQAFIKLCDENPAMNWELWCVGTGTIASASPSHHAANIHPRIKHFGFVQPAVMEQIIKDTDVFVLPSIIEPWGVVAHEFAAAGFTMVLSNAVGAKELFLTTANGFECEANNLESLKNALLKCTQLSTAELSAMSLQSNVLGNSYTPSHWANKVVAMMGRNK